MRKHKSFEELLLEHTEVRVLVDQLRDLTVGLSKPRVAFLVAELAGLLRHGHEHLRELFILGRYQRVAFVDLLYDGFYTRHKLIRTF